MMTREQLDQLVDSLIEPAVSFLQKMVRVPSENPPGRYGDIAALIAEVFQKWGFDTQVVEASPFLVEEEALENHKLNVLGRMKGREPGPTLILCGHLDTVPAGAASAWQYPPFSGARVEEKIFGRGAVDCKGRIAAYAAAAKGLREAGLLQKGELIVAATCDEETGGHLGVGYLLEEGILQGDLAIVEGYGDRIARAASGLIWCDLVIKGKPVHAAYKERGINAIEQARYVLEVLEDFSRELAKEPSQIPGIRHTSLNVGTINGGTSPNIVAEDCVLSLDLRVMPGHSLEAIYRRLEEKLLPLQVKGLVLELIPHREVWTEPTLSPENSPVLQSLLHASAKIKGQSLPVVGVPIQSDARYFLAKGIPAVNYGPGRPENGVHGINEHLEINDLVESIKILILAAGDLLGPGGFADAFR